MNIIDIIKTQRFFKAAFKYLLPRDIMLKLKEKGRYIVVNPENLESEVAKIKSKDDSMYSISVLPSSELNKSFDEEFDNE